MRMLEKYEREVEESKKIPDPLEFTLKVEHEKYDTEKIAKCYFEFLRSNEKRLEEPSNYIFITKDYKISEEKERSIAVGVHN